jgi:putative Mn2+ efflux pump MntP
MSITELLLLSVGLAMDAFSVSVCKGLSMKKLDLKGGVVTALFF